MAGTPGPVSYPATKGKHMSIPVQITSRDFEVTEAIADFVHKRVEKLAKYSDRIKDVEVVFEAPPKHKHKGNQFNLRLLISVPGPELVIKRQENEDVYVALRDAFKAAERLLEDASRKRRGEVKHHEDAPEARVKLLNPVEEYGFLETADGEEIYFHRNSVVNGGFGRLNVGHKVRYVAAMGEKGLQATTVEHLD